MSSINQNIDHILDNHKTIAVVGLSDKPDRASHSVARTMQRAGYRVIPVNPTQSEILGETAYPSLKDIPEKVDLVDIFRRPEHVDDIVDEAIEIGARAVWMQLGVVNESAARKAEEAGLDVVMDRCWAIEYRSR